MESNTWCPLFTAAMILFGSFVHWKGLGSALVSARKRLIAACSSTTEQNTPHWRRRVVSLARLSQLDLDFGNFATARCRLGQEECALSQRVSAETGCGADQAPCETASGFGRLASCFYATSFAARTARSTATGAS